MDNSSVNQASTASTAVTSVNDTRFKGNKTPPLLCKSRSYDDWVKKVKIWRRITCLLPQDQGGAILMTLEGESEDKALELSEEDITSEEGVEKIIAQLDVLFKKNTTLEKFEALDSFETYRRSSDVSIHEFVIEFDKRYLKTKKLGTEMSDDLLAYRMIKSANLSEQDEKVVKATTALAYEDIKTRLKTMFGDQTSTKSEFLPVKVKTEDTFESSELGETALFASKGRRGKFPQKGGRKPRSPVEKNPLDDRGNPTQCLICKSEYHWANRCPHRGQQGSSSRQHDTVEVSHSDNTTLLSEHLIMQQSSNETSDSLTDLMKETWNSAVLDCGATKTVTGRSWYKHYYTCLPEADKKLVTIQKSSTFFRFGDGQRIASSECVKIPAKVGNKAVFISVDIIEKDIPLLLSRDSMKKAKMEVNFSNDQAVIFGEKIDLTLTKSGHYTIPLTSAVKILRNFEKGQTNRIVLTLTECRDDKKKAIKLHSQFAHASSGRIIKLLKSAGPEWSNKTSLFKELEVVEKNCESCMKFKKAPARPVVGLPLGKEPNECVSMDLFFFQGNIVLHMIDVVSRLSSGRRLNSKKPSEVIKGIFHEWLKNFGAPLKFLTDNGGEFANEEFIELCEQHNIIVKTTAAESPWSNGIIERHNATMEEMLGKVLDEKKCDFDVALASCFSAKNSLMNVDGFTPFQLHCGRNPRLPSTCFDSPASYEKSSSEIVQSNLDTMFRSRKAFIASESSDRIKKALSHNTRSSNGVKFCNGDVVFYKRKDRKEWKGPGVVIGQEGQEVLVKHGSYYVRVHPCRLLLKNESDSLIDGTLSTMEDEIEPTQNSRLSNGKSVCDIDSDEEDYITNSNSQTSSVIRGEEENPPAQYDNMPENVLNDDAPSKSVDSEDTDKAVLMKRGVILDVKRHSQDWESVKLVNRAGKKKGKYGDSWNVENLLSGEKFYVDLDRTEWKLPCEIPDENLAGDVNGAVEPEAECLVNEVIRDLCSDEVNKAKEVELLSWKDNNVYDPVEDKGQTCMSVKWIVTPKTIDGRLSCKARLCARGFEEEQPFRTDSPTCSKEAIRLLLSLIASKSWAINAIDIKSAFLQGNIIERDVYIRPPIEAKTDLVWKLKKCVYGLADAPRQWYVKLRNELGNLGVKVSKYDDGLFYCHKDSELIGILTCHVDDIIWGGNSVFKKTVVDVICKIFKISREVCSAFIYLGVNLTQDGHGMITLDQTTYAKSLTPLKVSQDQMLSKNTPLTPSELTMLRRSIGQLNWLACMSRPDISFDVSVISSNITSATVNDIIHANKIINRVQKLDCKLVFPSLDLKSMEICSYSDSSYNNLKDGGSQGGHVVFLKDKYSKCCILEWKSNRIRRTVRSALAAESLSCAESVEADVYWQRMIEELLGRKVPLSNYIDSDSLCQNLSSKKAVADRLLRVDINVIIENINRHKLNIIWTDTKSNLSDILTKAGVCPRNLLAIVSNGRFKV